MSIEETVRAFDFVISRGWVGLADKEWLISREADAIRRLTTGGRRSGPPSRLKKPTVRTMLVDSHSITQNHVDAATRLGLIAPIVAQCKYRYACRFPALCPVNGLAGFEVYYSAIGLKSSTRECLRRLR